MSKKVYCSNMVLCTHWAYATKDLVVLCILSHAPLDHSIGNTPTHW